MNAPFTPPAVAAPAVEPATWATAAQPILACLLRVEEAIEATHRADALASARDRLREVAADLLNDLDEARGAAIVAAHGPSPEPTGDDAVDEAAWDAWQARVDALEAETVSVQAARKTARDAEIDAEVSAAERRLGRVGA